MKWLFATMEAMSALSPLFLLLFITTLAAMAWLALAGGRRVRLAEDFTLAGRGAGSWHVAGAIMGTLVGGASTIGTVQLAFLFGLSAWWFTLGAGLACLFLGLFLAGPLRERELETIPQLIGHYHGERARLAASLFSSAGMFIHVVAQLLAAAAILSALFGFSLASAAQLSAVLVALAVLAGGMHSAGPFGLAKLALLYLIMLSAGLLALGQSGGAAALFGAFPAYPWFSPFGYGVGAGLNDLLSMLVGVLSTQTYLQAIFAARDRRAARSGALLSAVLIPPLGLLGIAVGLHMRQIAPEMASVQALPVFVQSYFPPALAGLAFAALLIAAVGTAAGLTLGVVTTLSTDIISRFLRRVPTLSALRWLGLAVLLLALLLTVANLGSAIMSWSFLSMGLRGSTLALPLLSAILLGARTPRRAGALAIILAPIAVLWTGMTGWPDWPPLYPGLAVAATIMAIGFCRKARFWGR